mmetsp:Transcript_43114/g.93922  ORF Transcript_43114/g.93922 Transcript_43114/m.93922 type:complete len:329 (+) Transcript_43114:47-1033(+)
MKPATAVVLALGITSPTWRLIHDTLSAERGGHGSSTRRPAPQHGAGGSWRRRGPELPRTVKLNGHSHTQPPWLRTATQIAFLGLSDSPFVMPLTNFQEFPALSAGACVAELLLWALIAWHVQVILVDYLMGSKSPGGSYDSPSHVAEARSCPGPATAGAEGSQAPPGNGAPSPGVSALPLPSRRNGEKKDEDRLAAYQDFIRDLRERHRMAPAEGAEAAETARRRRQKGITLDKDLDTNDSVQRDGEERASSKDATPTAEGESMCRQPSYAMNTNSPVHAHTRKQYSLEFTYEALDMGDDLTPSAPVYDARRSRASPDPSCYDGCCIS